MLSKLRNACFLYFSIAFLVNTSLAASVGPVGTLTLANRDIAPDGFTRSASLVNGAHPGPLITANRGDKFKLNVVNRLTDELQLRGASIHWHGILQRGTNFMDGTVGVTQCPIAPGEAFQYRFNGDVPGTYWYHSHFGLQYCDGVRGVLVVYDPRDPLRRFYDVDDESTVITLADWYHTLANSIVGIDATDSVLINGKGRYPTGPNAELAVVNVQRGKRYRLRVVSISCDPDFRFSIDGHDLTIIEVEGDAVRPHAVDSIQILAGQRYSVVLNANQRVDNYWIRSLPSAGNRNITSTFDNGVNSAILRYRGAPNANPRTSQQSNPRALVETDLHPTTDPIAPGRPQPDGADVTFNLTMGFDPETFMFNINNRSFVPPTIPVLLQIMSGARNAFDLLPEGSVLPVERNKVVQINIPSALIGGPHPFHLHGHSFSVVRSADANRFNFLDPVRRDTVNAGETLGDFVSIRFKTDNPGPWIFHCHIDFHLEDGLAIVFAEAPDQTPAANPTPDDWEQLCPIWDALPESIKTAQTISPTGPINVPGPNPPGTSVGIGGSASPGSSASPISSPTLSVSSPSPSVSSTTNSTTS